MFSTYYKNNFVVSLLLMNVRCEISKKKKKKKKKLELRSVKER